MRCVPSSVFTMRLYQGKSKVYGYAHWERTCFSPYHFHTQQQQQPCSYTLWKMIFALTKGAASFLASTKSNFPNHYAAYLTIIICRSTRPSREILEIVSVKLYREFGMITFGDCSTKKTNKNKKTQKKPKLVHDKFTNEYREQQGENMDTSTKQGKIHFWRDNTHFMRWNTTFV